MSYTEDFARTATSSTRKSGRAITRLWWTGADAAELDVLTWEFVRVAFVHKERCSACAARGPWCAQLRDAFAAVTEWRQGRVLLSQAQYLRLSQEGAAA